MKTAPEVGLWWKTVTKRNGYSPQKGLPFEALRNRGEYFREMIRLGPSLTPGAYLLDPFIGVTLRHLMPGFEAYIADRRGAKEGILYNGSNDKPTPWDWESERLDMENFIETEIQNWFDKYANIENMIDLLYSESREGIPVDGSSVCRFPSINNGFIAELYDASGNRKMALKFYMLYLESLSRFDEHYQLCKKRIEELT